ncbi:hypothetical protein PR003_g613 [Phytophthora rubi]|uniref:RxLR effector protein n=1 Tax=Phytophthora rubi TaxID=129364 RepID=A0A6A4G402_9STRA|nr:hypothetical protein PR002_g77 [Phytophthora rubi]KAE9051066.1 hypothetical protein PR001_g1795 [Phytophthora rubi]KAE9359654.1 hypothetical protein PR003_g613 [Phytophthora rubi]
MAWLVLTVAYLGGTGLSLAGTAGSASGVMHSAFTPGTGPSAVTTGRRD